MKVRKKIGTNIHILPGDIIKVGYNKQTILSTEIDRTIRVDEAVIFDVEEGDFEGAVDGIGGAFIQKEE